MTSLIISNYHLLNFTDIIKFHFNILYIFVFFRYWEQNLYLKDFKIKLIRFLKKASVLNPVKNPQDF